MSICTFNNWFWNLVLILVFPIMLVQLSGYVFIAFNIIVIFTVVFVALTVSSDQMDAPKKPKGLGLGLGVLQIFCKFRKR